MFELCYTSLPRGLIVGTSGYTTVGHTSAMNRALITQAEKLSSYSFLLGDPTAYAREPINWVHLRVDNDGLSMHILSRIAACEPDYTGRSNYLAHHAFLTPQEAGACKAGPAALVSAPGFLATQWQGEARFLPVRTAPAIMDRGPSVAAIESVGLDAGWGGALADRLRNRGIRQTFVIYSPGSDIIGIVCDVLSELTPDERWQATFATHSTKAFPGLGVDCRLQCVVAGTPYAQEVLARFPSDAFDLTKHAPPPPRAQRSQSVAATASRSVTVAKATMSSGSAARAPRADAYANASERDSQFDPSSLGQYPIAPPPVVAERRGGFGRPAYLLPAVLAGLMTIACGLLGYQWSQTQAKVVELQKKNESVLEKLAQSKKNAIDAEGERTAARTNERDLRKQLEETQKRLAALEKSVRESKTERQKVDPQTEAAAASSPSPDTAEQRSGSESAGVPVAKVVSPTPTSTDIPPPGGESDAAEVRPETPPRVPPTVKDSVDDLLNLSPNQSSRITLVESLRDPPSGVMLNTKSLYKAIGASVAPKAGNPSSQWVLKLTGKTAGYIKYEQNINSLVLEFQNSQTAYLARFLTLNVVIKGVDEPLVFALGSPIDTTLELHAIMPDEQDINNKKTRVLYRLFKSVEANELLGRILKDSKELKLNLYESLVFLPEEAIESCSLKSGNVPPSMRDPAVPDNSVVLSQKRSSSRIGVILRRPDPDQTEYALHSCVIDPLKYGALSQEPSFKGRPWGFSRALSRGQWFFTESEVEDITAAADSDLKVLNDAEIKKMYPKGAEMVDIAKKADAKAFADAKHFFYETLLKKNHRVRFELKDPGTDVGFVVVDSLGVDAPPSPQGSR